MPRERAGLMGDVHPFPTEEARDRCSFERYHRAMLKARGASEGAVDYAMERFWPVYEELARQCLFIRFPPEFRESMREMKAHYDGLNARLVHETLVAFAETYESRD